MSQPVQGREHLAATAVFGLIKKVEICHKGLMMRATEAAVSIHLNHGGTLGMCVPESDYAGGDDTQNGNGNNGNGNSHGKE